MCTKKKQSFYENSIATITNKHSYLTQKKEKKLTQKKKQIYSWDMQATEAHVPW